MDKALRAALLSSPDDFLAAAVSSFPTKPAKSALKTLISSATAAAASSLPTALHLAVIRSLADDSFPAAAAASSSPAHARAASRSPPAKRTRRRASPPPPSTPTHLQHLHCYAYILHLAVTHPKHLFPADSLLPAAQALHDSIARINSDPLSSTVAAFCEDWWKAGLPGKETLISQSIPYILTQSLTHGKKVDVKRVYSLREAFTLFDYGDESIVDVKTFLLRCVVMPVYLKTEEGRRFLSFIMGLSDQLAKEVLAIVKSNIPFGRKSVLEGFADVVFRAWKGSEGELREEIEDRFLQGLVEGAIYARSDSLAAHVRRVLRGFVDQRATEGVEKVLFRLVEPVLFRSLQVWNSNVRKNALHMFLDMFPLEDPDVTKDVKDSLLEKQFFLLERLLVDDCPEVRAVAVEGSCRILHLFWEVIPSPTITKILTKIVDDMSRDLSTEVRLSTVNGIIYLLGNPQSHEVMKVLLTRLGGMLSDPALSVRVAVTDLLLSVRDVRGFQFIKVAGLDALLFALANDHIRVAQKITRLLTPSYFPSKLTLKEACTRIVALIKRSPTAGARFCEFALSEGSSAKSLMELLKVTVSLALSSKSLNSDQIDGMFIASANISHSLMSVSSSKATLTELFSSDRLKCLLTAASSQPALTAVLSIASLVSPQNLAGFRDQFMALVTNCVGVSENVDRQEVVQAVHKLMVYCGWVDDLFGALTKKLREIASSFIIQFGLQIPPQAQSSFIKKATKSQVKASGRYSKGKSSLNPDMSKTEEDFAVAAAAGWQLKDLLTNTVARNTLLDSPKLEIAFSALCIISQASIEQSATYDFLDTSPIMAYTTFAIYMSLPNMDSFLEQTTFDHTLDHLLNCAEKLFGVTISENSSCGPSMSVHQEENLHRDKRNRKENQLGTPDPTEGGDLRTELLGFRRVQNAMKVATSVLMFIADSATIGLVMQNHIRCLRFASAYARHIISFTETIQHEKSSFKDENLKEASIYLKSSFTYAVKLLYLVLKSSTESAAPPREASCLANDLLDLVVSIELYLGSRYASHIASVSKEWLPILILGLGSRQLIEVANEGGSSNIDELNASSVPVWLALLGKAELQELEEVGQDGQGSVPEAEPLIFKNLMGLMVKSLKKGDPKILDAVGAVFFKAVDVGLKMADYGLVLGLVHFLCVKILDKDLSPLKDLVLIPCFLQEVCLLIEGGINSPNISEDGRKKLENAMTLLGSFLTDSLE